MATTQPFTFERTRINASTQFRRLLPELRCAIFLWGIGDRDPETLKSIAYGKTLGDAIGRALPLPPGFDRAAWETALEEITDRFGATALRAMATAA